MAFILPWGPVSAQAPDDEGGWVSSQCSAAIIGTQNGVVVAPNATNAETCNRAIVTCAGQEGVTAATPLWDRVRNFQGHPGR